jgi:hypothetical protein
MSELREAALAYAKRGWPIFPCRSDKTPYTSNGVLDATTDPEVINAWWDKWPGANIAFAVGGADFLVIDYDPGSNRDEVAKALGGKIPPTKLVSRTPRGGTHEFYQLSSDDEPIASSVEPFAKHVDIRSFHGYVLLPPSATKDGVYVWEQEGRAGNRTQALLEACKPARAKHVDRDNWIIEPDLPQHIDRAIQWLEGKIEIGGSWCKIAIENAGGDNTTYATAAMMKSCGLSEERAAEVMWEHWNERCIPPWPWEDIQTKASHAYEYNTSAPGNVTQAYQAAKVAIQFQPIIEPAGEGRTMRAGRYRFVDWGGMQAIPDPTWLLPDFLTDGGYGMLIGPRSSLKTFIALDAALTVATGGYPSWEDNDQEWRGVWDAPAKPGPVLYAVGEGRSGIRLRANGWARLHWAKRPSPSLYLADPVPRVSDGLEALDGFIEGALKYEPYGYRLVVIDTVGRAMQGLNENAQEHASSFTAMVEHLQRNLCDTVLAVHHTGHEAKDRGRGSSVFEADADTLVVVERDDQDKYSKLKMTKQKDAPEWESPRWVEAVNIRMDLEGNETTLAMARMDKKEEKKQARKKVDAGAKLHVVDKFAMKVLKSNIGVEMTTSTFAVKISAAEDEGGGGVGLDEQTIRKHYLSKIIMPSNDCEARQYYDAAKSRWRYLSSVD